MKRLIISVTGKFVLGIMFIAGSFATHAQSNGGPVANEKSATVKYLGVQDDMVLFNVSVNNPGGKKFSVIVKDQDNTQLFQRVYTDKQFDKQFKLPRADKNTLTFVIRDFKGADITQSFAINVNTRYVEDIAIKQVR